MNCTTQYDQKLISRSKTMLIFFRALFLLFAAIAIIPWLFPTSNLGYILLTMTPKASTLSFYNNNHLMDFLSSLTMATRAMGLVGSILSLFPMLAGSLIMIRLTKNYIHKEIFSLDNARAYTQLGVVFLLSALLLAPITDALMSLIATLHYPAGHNLRVISVSFGSLNMTEIFLSIIFIILGHVMKLGHKISEEQELTV
ncbi:MAG: DUF2975 domain-containing protein [Pseudomonadota bacterium]